MREYWGCLNNPQWRAVLKAWVKVGIRRGVDGFIANYFYRHNCLCRHCVAGFKRYLSERFTADQLRERFGIADLAAPSVPRDRELARPQGIDPAAPGDAAVLADLDQAGLRRGLRRVWPLAQARPDRGPVGPPGRLRPDHRRRALPPAGRALGPGRGLSLVQHRRRGLLHRPGRRASSARARCRPATSAGAFDDKPYTLGKYESTRIRVAIAELAANGGAPMGFYTHFKRPEARREIVRYYGFLRENDALYHANRSHAEVVLLYPRRKVHEGDVAAVEAFKRLGRGLLDRPRALRRPARRPGHAGGWPAIARSSMVSERRQAGLRLLRSSAGSRPRRRSASRRAGRSRRGS